MQARNRPSSLLPHLLLLALVGCHAEPAKRVDSGQTPQPDAASATDDDASATTDVDATIAAGDVPRTPAPQHASYTDTIRGTDLTFDLVWIPAAADGGAGAGELEDRVSTSARADDEAEARSCGEGQRAVAGDQLHFHRAAGQIRIADADQVGSGEDDRRVLGDHLGAGHRVRGRFVHGRN